MFDELGKGRTLYHSLYKSITKNSKFIIMNREGYRDLCEWASLWYGQKCFPDMFADIPIVLDFNGSTYMKVVEYASKEYNMTQLQ